MEPNRNGNVERIVSKAMKASQTEKPSLNFTNTVMSEIEVLETQKIRYRPIISNRTWVILFVGVLALIGSISFFEGDNQSTYLDNFVNLIEIDFSFFNRIPNITIPKVLWYAILLFGLLFGIQIPLIKHYYFKRNKLSGI